MLGVAETPPPRSVYNLTETGLPRGGTKIPLSALNMIKIPSHFSYQLDYCHVPLSPGLTAPRYRNEDACSYKFNTITTTLF